MPAVQKARSASQRSQCLSNLHEIGVAIQMYYDTYSHYPDAAQLPSNNPNNLPTLIQALNDFDGQDPRIFRCPLDTEYYPVEGLSYEYPESTVGGKTLPQLERNRVGSHSIWLAYDYSNFHGPAGMAGSRDYLYADGHCSN
jgi:hypothetical protein